MPYEIKFDKPPAGYCLTAGRAEETVPVQAIEFTSTEDGPHFIQRVEGFPDEVLRMVSATKEIAPSQVDHMLMGSNLLSPGANTSNATFSNHARE